MFAEWKEGECFLEERQHRVGKSRQAEHHVIWKEMRAAQLFDLVNHVLGRNLAGYNGNFAKIIKMDVLNSWRGSFIRLFHYLQIKNQTVTALVCNRLKSFACGGRYIVAGFCTLQ